VSEKREKLGGGGGERPFANFGITTGGGRGTVALFFLIKDGPLECGGKKRILRRRGGKREGKKGRKPVSIIIGQRKNSGALFLGGEKGKKS